ncbi:hypothetical protein CBM2597_U20055 [Cupriavidus taiwanensis]|uniref:Uncharacterized protein n=1 Tax=Cupriavidus taiwanensis TaxID=164546 RepID=A0A375DXD6_9BURK|nr:hypothetical protein CBM2587_U10018 [Cupriavidus taiwanensis]SOZ18645.1 hypothetical protein CBM2597_U20055 [Cupriavidus taiwanensis]SPC26042.1 hypothetical protein CBM2594_U30064 [Cupriavidus taiwanensis]
MRAHYQRITAGHWGADSLSFVVAMRGTLVANSVQRRECRFRLTGARDNDRKAAPGHSCLASWPSRFL